MHDSKQFMRDVLELVERAKSSYHNSTNAIRKDVELLKEVCNELTSYRESLTLEMTEAVETMERVLRSTAQDDDPSKAFNLLESLKACFDSPTHGHKKAANHRQQQLTVALQIIKDSMIAKRSDVLKVHKIILDYSSPSSIDPRLHNGQDDSFLATITAISDPGKFYVTRWCAMNERDRFFDSIQNVAPTCPAPNLIVPGEMYVIFNKGENKWFRAYTRSFQVGDDPSDLVYDCFMVDIGRHEGILKSSIRMLPDELKGRPPYTIECTLNANFEPRPWSPEATAGFKDWTSYSPIVVQVLAKQGQVLHVDLSRLVDKNRTVSLMDCLTLRRTTEQTHNEDLFKKYQPRFSLLEQSTRALKNARVYITEIANPKFIYVQLSEDKLRYHGMLSELQAEFRSATCQSSSYCPSPVVGHPYAVSRSLGIGSLEWRRVLVEISSKGTKLIFFVDTGHREDIQPSMIFHQLPDRLLELPALAIRCSLSNVFPPNRHDRRYPGDEIYHFMRRYIGKQAVAFIDDWRVGQVGYSDMPGALPELILIAFLYRNGDDDSINQQVGRTSMASFINKSPNKLLEYSRIRENLLAPLMTYPVILVDCKGPCSIYFRTPELMKEFIKIHNALQAHFAVNTDSTEDPSINFEKGFTCAVKSGQRWYRAVVADMEQYPSIGVSLLDKGDSCYVKADDIRRLPEELEGIPSTVLCCSFDGIYPHSGTVWNEKIADHIIDRLRKVEQIVIECRQDLFKKRSDGEPLPVTVYVSCTKGGDRVSGAGMNVNVNEELVSVGLASSSPDNGTSSLPIMF